MGTSDDVFLWVDNAAPGLSGHVWLNTVHTGSYIVLIWYYTKLRHKKTCLQGFQPGSTQTHQVCTATDVG